MSKKIKLVIEIFEEDYNDIKKSKIVFNEMQRDIGEAIANGTPITEGDMISREGIRKALNGAFGCEDATKYGNKNAEQQSKSYSTLMLYEIADIVEDCCDNAPTVEPEITDEDLKGGMTEAFKNGYEMAKAKFERPKGECKTCKHYKPIMQRDICGYSPRGDGYCDIRRMTQDGELEINVNDDFYCKYYERGDENGKS